MHQTCSTLNTDGLAKTAARPPIYSTSIYSIPSTLRFYYVHHLCIAVFYILKRNRITFLEESLLFLFFLIFQKLFQTLLHAAKKVAVHVFDHFKNHPKEVRAATQLQHYK